MNAQDRQDRVGGSARLGALVALPLLAWAAPAAAQSATPGLSAGVAAAVEPARMPRFGVQTDVGAPDGASVSVVYRPIRSIRASVGLAHNLISLGERAGVTWAPLHGWATPTLSLEYGHFAEGNANPLARMATGDQTISSPALERVGYDYGNARIGLELGRKWFTFYLHAGMSRISGQVHNLSAAAMSESSGTTTVSFSRDPNVTLWVPSASLGFIVYIAK
jgi:hypothetical protein